MTKKNFMDEHFEKDIAEMSVSEQPKPASDDFRIKAGPLKSVAQVLRQEGKPYAGE